MIREIYLFLKASLDPLLFSLILFGFGLWKFRRVQKDKTWRWCWGFLFSSFTLLALFSLPITAQGLAHMLQYGLGDFSEQPTDPLDAIVVLSAGLDISRQQRKPKLSTETAARFLHGVDMFMKNRARKLIFSGRTHPQISEAQIMSDLAVSFGIPQEQILLEDNARNTWEHALYVHRMFPDPKAKIALVTSAIHMQRSVQTFKQYFSEVFPMPSTSYTSFDPSAFSSYFYPQTKSLYLTTQICREYVGLLWYGVRNKNEPLESRIIT